MHKRRERCQGLGPSSWRWMLGRSQSVIRLSDVLRLTHLISWKRRMAMIQLISVGCSGNLRRHRVVFRRISKIYQTTNERAYHVGHSKTHGQRMVVVYEGRT